ncbi:MAG: ABC transporter substrate-binding protein, partial [Terriglobia bacterium]
AFKRGLRDLGWIEGENITIEYRWAEGRYERFPSLAAELVRLKVDVIVAAGETATRAAMNATGTIPIVIAVSSDPVAAGLVASLARPGGNVTGLSSLAPELSGKRLELFKEAFPKVRHVAVLWTTVSKLFIRETQAAAQSFRVKILSLEVRSVEDFDNAFAVIRRERPDGLLVIPSAIMTVNSKRIIEFAAKNRLPATYPDSRYVEAGGLMSYGTNFADLYRRAAPSVDKILKGTKPADLPVEQPMRFEFIVSLIAAKQIGVTIPPNVLVRADKVIR